MNNEDLETLHSVVVGVGAAGIRALKDMMAAKIENIGFVAVDANSSVPVSAHIKKASINELESVLKDAVIVSIVAEMGDESITETVRTIAKITKDIGIYITVGVFMLPFSQECTYLPETAEKDIRSISSYFDSLIVIPNYFATDFDFSSTGSLKVIKVPAEVVRGITDLVGSINLIGFDYADVKTVLPSEYPVAFGVGIASGNDRALEAAKKALHPLSCGGVDISRASGALVTLAGSSHMSMEDYNDVNRFFNEMIRDDANIKIGIARDESLDESVKVSLYLSKSM